MACRCPATQISAINSTALISVKNHLTQLLAKRATDLLSTGHIEIASAATTAPVPGNMQLGKQDASDEISGVNHVFESLQSGPSGQAQQIV